MVGYHNSYLLIFCKMENFILDPSKWEDSKYIYLGPIDLKNRGCPLISKGFFSMSCQQREEINDVFDNYYRYLESWNYEYDNNNEEMEELAPGKTIFFMSRNQDSPNLFHGGSEFINAICIMYLLNLKPEDIKIIFLESIAINNDPYDELYKNVLSRGGEPIHIKNLKKKYHIKSAVHVPINWDSPCFIQYQAPTCKYPTKTYQLFNYLVNRYMKIEPFKDSFVNDNKSYYPKSTIEYYKSRKRFKKSLTFIWRRVWPPGRKGQYRILGNGPELVEKLTTFIPKNILIRLIDTAAFPLRTQIALARVTDYFYGIHGAGFTLSIFSPPHCIIHEVLPSNQLLLYMASLSGHQFYSDNIKTEKRDVDGNQNIFINEEDFARNIMLRMKDSHFLD